MIIQTLEELEKNIRGDNPPNVYLVLGPELYLCRLAVDLLKEKFVSSDATAFDYSEFSAGEVSVEQILESANTFPMIAKKRFVLVRDAGKLKEAEQDELLNSIGSISKRSILLLSAEELDHRKRFYRALREKYFVAEFQKLKGPALESWAAIYIQRKGYRCSSSAIKKIVDLAGADLQTLIAELDKLLLYAGSEKNISESAISALVGISRQQGIFDLIGAVGKRDRNASLRSLANLLSMGEHPLVIVAMLARHCRQVLIAKECLERGAAMSEISSAAQLPPFLLDTFIRQARAVDNVTMRQMYIQLADMDRKLKSSASDGRMLLEKLICALV